MERLPVEIVHRIFDNLDAETILFSIRSVSRLFRSIVNTYDRYIFDLKSISKTKLYLLCRLINPENVISLKLYDNEHTPNEISLFISLNRLRKFTRLHSITLFGIDELQLNIILKHIQFNSIISFSLNIQKYDDRRKKTTLKYLSLIISQPTLTKLELNIKTDRISDIIWPLNSKIQYLIIHENIDFHIIAKILHNSSQLHTLILKQNLFNIISTSSFPQLTSLTIEKLHITIDELETLLLMTPSLTHLKLIAEGNVYDGKRWEEFIRINLSYLNHFQFFTDFFKSNIPTHEDLELIIQSFQTPFWIEYKKWFIAGQFNRNYPYKIQIYSLPICKSILQYDLDTENIFLSTSTILMHNDPSILHNINEISLPLKMSTDGYIQRRKYSTINPLFSNATKLSIDFGRRISLDLFKILPSMINISQLTEVKLESHYFNKDNKKFLFDVITILEQSHNLSSLIIHSRFCKYELYPYLNNLCSILPCQIKHLQIPINQLDQIKIILERCQYLSVLQFEITRMKFSAEVVHWFGENTIDSTIRRLNGSDIIWIGKKMNENNLNHKRIKLIDNQLES